MKNVNIIAVFDKERKSLLMCRRRKPPYQGLLNLVGGKLEPGEDGYSAAYRELQEETGISRAEIELIHLMDFVYYIDDVKLEVYFGYLTKEVCPDGEENELLWVAREQNFCDNTVFAGKGNLWNVMENIKLWENRKVLKD